MENQIKTKVIIEEISKENNEVYIKSEQGEGWFMIKQPANIQWAKIGEADVTIVGNAINYLRSTSAGPVQKKQWNNSNTGFKFIGPSKLKLPSLKEPCRNTFLTNLLFCI